MAATASALTPFVVTFVVILNTTAADPEMLQHVCVADLSSRIPLSLLLLFIFFMFNRNKRIVNLAVETAIFELFF